MTDLTPQEQKTKKVTLEKELIIQMSYFTVPASCQAETPSMIRSISSSVGRAGIAPLFVTVSPPHALANRRACLNRFSSCQ